MTTIQNCAISNLRRVRWRRITAAVACTAGGLACAAAVAPAVAATATTAPAPSVHTETTTVRPNGDVHPFGVVGAASAATALADPVAAPRVPGSAGVLSAAAPSSTTVSVSSAPLNSGTALSHAWFYGSTGAGTSLRVEVLWNGVVHAATTLAPNTSAAWHSLAFTPPNQAAVNGLQLRFVSVGGAHAVVRAAYVVAARATRPALTLRPDATIGALTSVPSGTAASALDDVVTMPNVPTDARFLRAATSDRSTTVTLGSTPLGGARPSATTAWFFAGTSSSSLRVEAVSGGVARAATVVAPGQAARWRSISVPMANQAALDDLQLRFLASGPGVTTVRAAYARVLHPVADTSQINAYLEGLTPISAGADQSDHPIGSSTSTTSDPLPAGAAPTAQNRYACTSTPYSVSTAPDKIVALNPDSNKLWLGGLLQGRGYADGLGSLRELPIRKRAPLTIYTDLLGAKVSRTVTDPDAASVQQAIADLVQQATDARLPVPARVSYSETQEHSSTQALLHLGFSAKYLGASASAKLDVTRNAQENTLLASFVQRLFTVSIVTPSTPAAYFAPDFSMGDLQDQAAAGRVSPDNPPVVVGSISFGRILLYSMTSTASTDKMSAALDAAYSGGVASGTVNVSAEEQNILDNARYQVLALGGDENDVTSLIRSHKLGDYFTTHSSLATSVPISYQVNNIANDSAARFTESTDYNLTECTALPRHQVWIGAKVRLSLPQAYLTGPRDPADVYGNITAGSANWTLSRDATQNLRLHTVTDLRPWTDPNPSGVYTLKVDGSGPSSLSVSGSLNCKLNWWEFGSDPSNQYNWQWNVAGNQYGTFTLDGGSAHCGVQLRPTVTKVEDLYTEAP